MILYKHTSIVSTLLSNLNNLHLKWRSRISNLPLAESLLFTMPFVSSMQQVIFRGSVLTWDRVRWLFASLNDLLHFLHYGDIRYILVTCKHVYWILLTQPLVYETHFVLLELCPTGRSYFTCSWTSYNSFYAFCSFSFRCFVLLLERLLYASYNTHVVSNKLKYTTMRQTQGNKGYKTCNSYATDARRKK